MTEILFIENKQKIAVWIQNIDFLLKIILKLYDFPNDRNIKELFSTRPQKCAEPAEHIPNDMQGVHLQVLHKI